MNQLMKKARYEDIFKRVTGRKVSKLWKLYMYKEDLEGGGTSSNTYDPRASESEV